MTQFETIRLTPEPNYSSPHPDMINTQKSDSYMTKHPNIFRTFASENKPNH